jgi:soluble lytic murein transglycosylase-like protein
MTRDRRAWHPRLGLRLLLGLLMLAGLALIVLGFPQPAQAQSKGVNIPPAAALYRHRVEQATMRVFGVQGSPARLAAQLHQESSWRAGATSYVGAQGLAQFMPATARWMATQFPADLPHFDPWNPQQAILAAALYDKWLLDRVQPFGWTPLSECSRWNFVLRAYNGGETWLWRERGLTLANKRDPNNWREVEGFRSRGPAAHRENIGYPRRILLTLEPAYIAAGWPGKAACP